MAGVRRRVAGRTVVASQSSRRVDVAVAGLSSSRRCVGSRRVAWRRLSRWWQWLSTWRGVARRR
ncbi:hypothetical protein ACXZ9C_11795 [Streptococcus agalactiae]